MQTVKLDPVAHPVGKAPHEFTVLAFVPHEIVPAVKKYPVLQVWHVPNGIAHVHEVGPCLHEYTPEVS